MTIGRWEAILTAAAAATLVAAPLVADDGAAGRAAPSGGSAADAAARAPRVTGPWDLMPQDQILVVHIPEAARVSDRIDRLLATVHQETSQNPIRSEVARLKLGQALDPRSALTFCVAPPALLGGPTLRATLVTRIDPDKVAPGIEPDTGGVRRRTDAPPFMTVGAGAVAFGDGDAMPRFATVRRGVALSKADEEALRDADVLVVFDPRRLIEAHEPEHQALHAQLVRQLAARARDQEAPDAEIARLEARLSANRRLWAQARQVTRIALGLIVTRDAVDVRLALTAVQASSLGKALSGHPPLAGELNPPFPRQDFAALGYGSFDAGRFASLLQWAVDLAARHAVTAQGGAAGIGPAELDALGRLFADFPDILGRRAGFILPIRPADEPVVQLDAVVRLKDASAGTAWRGRLPAALDALAYLAGSSMRDAQGGPGRVALASQLDPASPRDKQQIDRWRLDVTLQSPPGGPERPASDRLVLDALLGRGGLSLWNTAAAGFGCFSVAPAPGRVPQLVDYAQAARFGCAGEDDRTAEALRHVVRRANVAVVFSPSLVTQLLSRVLLRSFATPHGQPLDVPLVAPEAYATLSARFAEGGISARLYLPVSELAPIFSARRTLQLLRRPSLPVEPAPPGE